MGLFLHETMYVPNTVSVIVAHTSNDSADLFDRARFMYSSVPEVFRPSYRRSNRRELFFEKINSRFYIGSAEAKDFGLSKTINNLHCSEVSALAWRQDMLDGLLEAVPRSGRVVLESTARGEGGPFHKIYVGAKEETNEFRTHYYRWYEHKEYQVALHPGERMSLDGEEQDLVDRVGLSLAQIKWRREKVSRLGKMFIQWYPELEDEDAFIRSGSPVFDTEFLKLRDKQLLEQNPTEIWLGGDLYIYRVAEAGARYYIGVDPSEGDINSDYSAAMVVRGWPLPVEQVALLHGRWTPDILSEKVYRIGMAYNKAMLVVERNNHGHAVILNLTNGIVRQGVVKYPPYPQIFVGPDRKLGFLTSSSSKPQIIQEIDREMRSGGLIVNSKTFISEAKKFQFLKQDRMGAASGTHDDVVMAAALALAGVGLGGFDFSFT